MADNIKCIDFLNKKTGTGSTKEILFFTLEAKIQERTPELDSVDVEVLSFLTLVLKTRDVSTF